MQQVKAFGAIHKNQFCETRPCYIAQVGQELIKLLPLPPESWDDRCIDHHAQLDNIFNFLN